jgi:hypothetical protein
VKKKWVMILIVFALLLSACSSGRSGKWEQYLENIFSREPAQPVPISGPEELSERQYERLAINWIYCGLLVDLNDMVLLAGMLEQEWNEDLYQEFKTTEVHVLLLTTTFSMISPPPKYEEVHADLEAMVGASKDLAHLLDRCVEEDDVSVFEKSDEIKAIIPLAKKALEDLKAIDNPDS